MSTSATPRPAKGLRSTIYDVARQASVSPATVSKVLRGVGRVGTANAGRVHQAVEDLGYRSDPLAANLRSAKRSLIGLIVPDFSNPFFGGLVASIERLAEGSGYRLVAVSSNESPARQESQIAALLDWRVGGLIVVPSAARLDAAGRLRREAIPAVVLDRLPKNLTFDGVGVDNAAASAQMVRHFYDLGHRRLLVAATTPKYRNMAERLEGVRVAAAAKPEAMAIETLFCGTDVVSASRAMRERFANGPPPSAVFALFNQGTLAALREIGLRNFRIPEDISIAGFDDSDWMQVLHPPIAAVVQPIEAMASAAWAHLLRRIENPHGEALRSELTCNVEPRGSIARFRPNP